MERQRVTRGVHRVRLVEHGLAVRQFRGGRITESANTGQSAEVMVERTVFLHQHDNVFDVLQRAVLRRSLRKRALHIR
jgi:hypothetical protein